MMGNAIFKGLKELVQYVSLVKKKKLHYFRETSVSQVNSVCPKILRGVLSGTSLATMPCSCKEKCVRGPADHSHSLFRASIHFVFNWPHQKYLNSLGQAQALGEELMEATVTKHIFYNRSISSIGIYISSSVTKLNFNMDAMQDEIIKKPYLNTLGTRCVRY